MDTFKAGFSYLRSISFEYSKINTESQVLNAFKLIPAVHSSKYRKNISIYTKSLL